MNKTQEELKQKTLEAIAEDIGEMLEHYDEVLEPEDTMSLPAERREARSTNVSAASALQLFLPYSIFSR
jgi:type III secretory pathway lipoprotein EscJ